MREKALWVDSLNIDPDQYQKWCKDVPEFTSVTSWCLKNRKIEPQTYLNWAREYYQLASLHTQFFEQTPPPIQLWKKLLHSASWSDEMLPVSEWDGIVFIACLELPKQENLNFPTRFILTSNENLNKYWKVFKDIFPHFKTASQKNQKNTPKNQKNKPQKDQANKENQNQANKQNLENIDPKWANSTKKLSENEEVISSKLEGLSQIQVDENPNINPYQSPQNQSPTHPRSSENLTNPPPDPKPDSSPTNTLSKMTDTKKLDSKPVFLEPFGISSNSDEIKNNEDLINWVFQQMSPYFSACLWFVLENQHLSCWRYTSNLKPHDSNQKIDYTQPSIFRIVFRTGLPYHGYTTSSPTNDQFFKNWGYEAHPEHVTAYPIKKNLEVTGVLMGLSDSNSNTDNALSQTERIVEKITSLMS